MTARRYFGLLLLVTLTACMTEEKPNDLWLEFGSIDTDEMTAVLQQAKSIGLEVYSEKDGELLVLRWNDATNPGVAQLICETVTPPPPSGRSVLLMPPMKRDSIERAMSSRQIGYRIHNYAEADYLVWREADHLLVEEIFRDLYGTGPRTSSNMEEVWQQFCTEPSQ